MSIKIYGANDLNKLAHSLLLKVREGQYSVKIYIAKITKTRSKKKEKEITKDEIVELIKQGGKELSTKHII